MIVGHKVVEVLLQKISDYQVPKKIHSKAGAEENIIMQIPLWPSAAENVQICNFCGISIIIFSLAHDTYFVAPPLPYSRSAYDSNIST